MRYVESHLGDGVQHPICRVDARYQILWRQPHDCSTAFINWPRRRPHGQLPHPRQVPGQIQRQRPRTPRRRRICWWQLYVEQIRQTPQTATEKAGSGSQAQSRCVRAFTNTEHRRNVSATRCSSEPRRRGSGRRQSFSSSIRSNRIMDGCSTRSVRTTGQMRYRITTINRNHAIAGIAQHRDGQANVSCKLPTSSRPIQIGDER